jgi:hypothetical protein
MRHDLPQIVSQPTNEELCPKVGDGHRWPSHGAAEQRNKIATLNVCTREP